VSSFDRAIQYVLDNEGGFSDDPNDHGGATRYGVTQSEAARHGFDVHTLTVDQAKSIYRTDYWHYDGVADQNIATKLLDMAVNMGDVTTVKIVQGICGVPKDGVIGPATLAAINTSSKLTLDALRSACVRRYARIVAADPTQSVFLVGWMERALKVPSA